MTQVTTIKVPRELRDRLAARADRAHTTLAGAIEAALADAEEQEFWAQVRRDNAHLPASLVVEYDEFAGTLTDGLADATDDALAPGDW